MFFRHFPSRSSLISRGSIPRALATVLLGLQALLWGGGSIIEARAAAESLSRDAHVEDQGTTACLPIHSHLDCLVCRTFSSGAITTRVRELLPVATRVPWMPDAPAIGVAGDGCNGQLGSRAPPRPLTPSAQPIA